MKQKEKQKEEGALPYLHQIQRALRSVSRSDFLPGLILKAQIQKSERERDGRGPSSKSLPLPVSHSDLLPLPLSLSSACFNG